ncbi:hypothetical protein PPSIR1_02928 [Plesiocystis pacifica SIR-1]|uniref:Lipoprotein n=1 Tax=Plesiocystis pacifica SIR-1 TaxID=391625 RepID=A6G956_9BACT|nr:hypothetical protein [Plesiocystis pacifica]EDM77604.1 hypothetical protein PPSIR1_02928 [Plesiocystis pacifica SIR-1]
MRLLNIVLAHAAIFGIAALAATSCRVNYPTTAFRCSPGGDDPNCPTQDSDEYLCCSDDPAAIQLSNINAVVTPKYVGRDGVGTPLFSGGNNALSTHGMCVKAGSVPIAGALADTNATGCPVPCNPNWDQDDREDVCGTGAICCQTVELEPEDCVLDPGLGNMGCYRPITGRDIAGLGGLDSTMWGGTEHKTHQDPAGANCMTFVAGATAALPDGVDGADLLQACYRRLGVADSRGFCLGGDNVDLCPLEVAGYRDACEQLNDMSGRVDCD